MRTKIQNAFLIKKICDATLAIQQKPQIKKFPYDGQEHQTESYVYIISFNLSTIQKTEITLVVKPS